MKSPVTAETILRLVSYMTAAVVFTVGIKVLSGFIVPAYVPENYRIMMGTVMAVYGVYRVVMLRIKKRQVKNAEEE